MIITNLVEITEQSNVILDIRYASDNNITGKPIYAQPRCYLVAQAAEALRKSSELAKSLGLTLCIFDGYRPKQAQQKLWHACPNEDYIVPPHIGSNHTRGIAIDLTLFDGINPLDMGSDFDDMSNLSHHGNISIRRQAQSNRYMLRGLMASAGWQTIKTEWWHYQLPGNWQLIDQASLSVPLVPNL